MSQLTMAVNVQGAVGMFPDDLERIAFGQLTLEEVAQIEDMVARGRQVLAELRSRADVIDLAQRRAERSIPGEESSRSAR